MEEEREVKNGLGTVRINNEVVAIIAGMAATEIPGVICMSEGIVGGITDIFTKKGADKGVKVEIKEKEVDITLAIVVRYGIQIPEVALQIQQNVKKQVEKMSGLAVSKVNVNVGGIHFPKEKKEPVKLDKGKEKK
ncbi:Asp23/Gls24 family envelope stress response protein [bacterium]|nr:Asp23/Gls24 family envelope stress response protein [bacterium]